MSPVLWPLGLSFIHGQSPATARCAHACLYERNGTAVSSGNYAGLVRAAIEVRKKIPECTRRSTRVVLRASGVAVLRRMITYARGSERAFCRGVPSRQKLRRFSCVTRRGAASAQGDCLRGRDPGDCFARSVPPRRQESGFRCRQCNVRSGPACHAGRPACPARLRARRGGERARRMGPESA